MLRFGENIVSLMVAWGDDFIGQLKSLSSSLVEDDEYLLLFILLLGVPAIIVLGLIARVIHRTHNRVRYATEYVEQDPDAFVTSSSSSEESGEEAADQYTVEEVLAMAQSLSSQEKLQRRAARRAEASGIGARGATGPPLASAPAPAASAEISDKKNN
ncbi:hypothetical protein ABL78_8088 [Leptomonas seymouri]|uniref:Transmembrane protein n=1 Tax=Leptomonas seymouri TaxID=5684 RepID=A0A0N1HZN0_LEPSE|nr:hypothetical protein ABL78_8088 [Leptomonas seymouri]|eukprot:KPI82902.1 hypothetical protein ABL78_8088 [Leptomonas seymouri]